MSGHGVPRISGKREKDDDNERRKIAAYTALVDDVLKRRRAGDLSSEALDTTSRLLGKNPEYYTIWNYRRRILQSLVTAKQEDALSLVSTDLQFLVPLLVQFPKCYWIWNYRLWLLARMNENLDKSDASRLWHDELALVSKMLVRDERNFHGWDYRRHVVSQIELARPAGSQTLVETEFEYSTKMIQKALQNFSALHYRSKLIPRLLTERKATPSERRRFFEKELELMQDALIDPFNQSAWFYHQFLMHSIHPSCPTDAAVVMDLSDEERRQYFDQEIERIQDILEDYDDCKWIYQALVQYHVDLQPSHANSERLAFWLRELLRLDPMRARRWHALAVQAGKQEEIA